MKFFDVKSLGEAQRLVAENLPDSIFASEEIELENANGRIAYENILSPDILPPFSKSTVDGFAVKSQNTHGANETIPALLKVVGSVCMGEMPNCKICDGEAVAIATGAAVPEGADAIVMVEHTEKMKNDIAVYSPVGMHENFVEKGEDIGIGQTVVKKGDVLSALKIAVLAGLGVSKIKVFKKINLAIVSTGDELVEITEKAENGKIRDINTTLLSSFSNDLFCVKSKIRVKDNFDELKNAVDISQNKADTVLISGGSSVGAKDFTERVLSEKGEMLFHGVSIKPGKPTMLSKTEEGLIFGLAGHPLASMVTFKLLLKNSLLSKMGQEQKPMMIARTGMNFPSSPGRTTVQMVSVENQNGEYLAMPVFLKSAHLASMLGVEGFIILPDNSEGINKGESVEIFSL